MRLLIFAIIHTKAFTCSGSITLFTLMKTVKYAISVKGAEYVTIIFIIRVMCRLSS